MRSGIKRIEMTHNTRMPERRRKPRQITLAPEARAVLDALPRGSVSELLSRLIVQSRRRLEAWGDRFEQEKEAG